MSSEDKTDNGKSNPAILTALDTVHRSLIFKNLEFNNGKFPSFDDNPQRDGDNRSSTTRRLDNLSDEVKSKYDKTKSQYKTHNNIIELNSTDLENVQNTVCEKLNKNCAHGVCYCFNSDSDDFQRKPREPPINVFNNSNSSNAGTLNLLDTINNLSDYLSSINCTTTDDDEYFTSHDYECDSLKSIKFVNRKNSLRRKKENRQPSLKKVEESAMLDVESQIISIAKKDDDVQSTSTHRLSKDFDEVFQYNESLQIAPISPQKIEPIVEPKYIAFRSRNSVNIELPHKSPSAPLQQNNEDARFMNLFIDDAFKSNTTITENLDKPIPKPSELSSIGDDVQLFDLFMESGGQLGSNGIKTIPSKGDYRHFGNQMVAESQETVIQNPKVKKSRSPTSVETIKIPAIPVQIGQQNGRRKKIKIRISAKSDKRNDRVTDISNTSNETSQIVESTENTHDSYTFESSTENTSYREYREPRVLREIVDDDDSPAIHIIQEISPDSFEISSKVILNKNKIRDLQNKKKKLKKSPKPTRKIITDNFCNEIIDNLNRSFDDALLHDEKRTSIIDLNPCELASGRLEANPKYSGRIIGELFARRLIKMEQKKQKSRTSLMGSSFENQASDVVTSVSLDSESENSKRKAPKKPPRTFVSSNSTVECDDEWLQTRLKNLLNEDVIPKSDLGKKIGWSMPAEKNDVQPSCPTYNELGCHVGWMSPEENKKRDTGWIFVDETGKQTQPPQNILNMLNYEPNQNVYTMLSTLNSKPSPQSKKVEPINKIPPKENIDTVDSVFRISPGNSPKKKKFNDFANFVENTTLKSTPEKSESARFIEFEQCVNAESKEIEELPDEEEFKPPNFCKKCALKKPDKKRSRVNDALKRTKTFFNSRIPILKHKHNTSDPELYVTPVKRTNLTATNMDLSSNKKKFNLVKNLGLITPKKLFQSQPPQFQCDSCHTSKTTSNNASPARNFDFNRVVISPKAKSFRLSPKRLFSHTNKKEGVPNPLQQHSQPQQPQSKPIDKNNIETYKSFADDNQSIMVQMGEFLTNIRGNLEQDNINNFSRNCNDVDNNMDDPIYAEIKLHKTSPVRDEKITELRYTVNNDPTAVYTVVDKKQKPIQQATYDDCSIEKKLSNEKYQKQHSYDTPERSLDDVSSYDASKFLRVALGSEALDSNYYDTIESQHEARNKRTPDTQELVVSLDNVSDLISYQSPNDSTITTPQQSPSNTSRFNNSVEFYRGVKEKLRNSIKRSKRYLSIERRKFSDYFDQSLSNSRSPDKQGPFERNQFNIQSEGEKLYQTLRSKLNESNIEITNQYLLHLINQISYQKSIKMQLSNAVSICRTTKEFECSTELIEAERLLLVSYFKELAAKDELVRIDYQRNGKIKNPSFNLGTLSIDHIECPLKEGIIRDNVSNYFYIAMCSYKERVLCTNSVERKGDRIIFPQCNIHFKDLEPAYEIKLEFFALRLRKTIRSFSHESKFHLNKEAKGFLTACPSPPKLSPGKLFQGTASLPKKINFDTEFSRFKSQGFVALTSFTISSTNVDDDNQNLTKIIKKVGNSYQFCLENRKEFKLSSMPHNSNMSGDALLSLKTEILLKNEVIEGFLNVGECPNESDSILWNRRWCRLDGLYMYFWNYPNQLYDDLKFKIDLTRTTYDEINLVDRSLCARSRTFVIEVFGYHKKDTKKSYYLSADNQTDLTKWMYELNNKIKFIRDWKV